jgi:hypothetical protein
MAAPTLGTGYMEIPSPVTSQPPNAAEAMPLLDPAFVSVWNATKYLIPAEWEGNKALIAGMADLANRYKEATGVTTPAITTIAPTTTVNSVAFTLTVNGTNFDEPATIMFAGFDVVTTFVSNLQLTASIGAGLIPAAGTYSAAVRNANNVVSNTVSLIVT